MCPSVASELAVPDIIGVGEEVLRGVIIQCADARVEFQNF
jgi:hypothetical protein